MVRPIAVGSDQLRIARSRVARVRGGFEVLKGFMVRYVVANLEAGDILVGGAAFVFSVRELLVDRPESTLEPPPRYFRVGQKISDVRSFDPHLVMVRSRAYVVQRIVIVDHRAAGSGSRIRGVCDVISGRLPVRRHDRPRAPRDKIKRARRRWPKRRAE